MNKTKKQKEAARRVRREERQARREARAARRRRPQDTRAGEMMKQPHERTAP